MRSLETTSTDQIIWSLNSTLRKTFLKKDKEALASLARYLDSFISAALNPDRQDSDNHHLDGSRNARLVEDKLIDLVREFSNNTQSPILRTNKEERERVIKLVLERLFDLEPEESTGSSLDGASNHPVFFDLIKVSIITPLAQFLDSMMNHPRKEFKDSIVKTMQSCGTDLSIAALLNLEKDRTSKLKLISCFDLQKIRDDNLSKAIYRLLREEKTIEDSTMLLERNLPALGTHPSKDSEYLIETVDDIKDTSEIYRVLLNFNFNAIQEWKRKEILIAITNKFSSLDRQSGISFQELIVNDRNKNESIDDPMTLAYFTAKLFHQIHKTFSDDYIVSELTKVHEVLIKGTIDKSFKECNALSDSAIIFLRELAQSSCLKAEIVDALKVKISYRLDLNKPSYVRDKTLVFLAELMGFDKFKSQILDHPDKYPNSVFSKELSLAKELISGDKLRQELNTNDRDKIFCVLNWARLIHSPKLLSELILEQLNTRAADTKHINIIETLVSSLASLDIQAYSKALELAERETSLVANTKTPAFFGYLIDAICSRIDSPEYIVSKNQSLDNQSNRRISDLTKELSFNSDKEQYRSFYPRLAKILVRLYNSDFLKGTKIPERIKLWLESSAFSQELSEQIAKQYNSSSIPAEMKETELCLRYLRYLSGSTLLA